MLKPDRTKEMSGDEANVKQKKAPRKLKCVRESEMPNVGLFQAGDIVEDAAKIEIIGDNPNFEDISEGGSL